METKLTRATRGIFISLLNFTDQGIGNIKDLPDRHSIDERERMIGNIL